MDRPYCSLHELLIALDIHGVKSEDLLLDMIFAASEYIEGEIGVFIPITAAERFDGTGHIDLWIPPCVDVTAVTNDGDSLVEGTDWLEYPRNRRVNPDYGFYTRLRVDPDATVLSAWILEEDAVVVTGKWGKWNQTETLSATVQNDPLAAGGTSLVVDDGSEISPAMNLLIGTEQVRVTATGAATDGAKNTNGALTVSIETVTMESGGATSYNVGEVIKIDLEQMYILDIQGNDIDVIRGWNDTKKATHTDASDVYVYRTFTIERAVNGTTSAEHAQSTAIARYVAPFDINYLCRQIAALMYKKSQTGFAGKTGNADLGEVFYHDEFPTKPITKAKNKYRVIN